MAITTYVSWIGAILLIVAFAVAGSSKLTDAVLPDIYKELVGKSRSWVKVWAPLAAQYAPQIKQYVTAPIVRTAIGYTEVALAVLLLVPGTVRQIASLVAVGLMAGAAYTHYALNEDITPPVVLLVLAAITFITSFESEEPTPKSGKRD